MKLMMQLERSRRGWTQSYVAQKAGITRPMVVMLETGKRKPSYDVLVRLEDLFGMSHRELFAAAPNVMITQTGKKKQENGINSHK